MTSMIEGMAQALKIKIENKNTEQKGEKEKNSNLEQVESRNDKEKAIKKKDEQKGKQNVRYALKNTYMMLSEK